MEKKTLYEAPAARAFPIVAEYSFLHSVTGDGPEGWHFDAEEGEWE